jgi:multidrug efflux pump subunit AcrA (membrane-fusion protein)
MSIELKRLWPAALALALLSALSTSGCGKTEKKAEAEEPPVPVQVADVRTGPIDRVVQSDAVLYPINQANVTPKISAPVKRVLVNRGDHVKAGQVVAELESRDLAAAVGESKSLHEQTQAQFQSLRGATAIDDKTKAEADVASSKQALEAAKRVYESRVELVKQGALARKLVDDAQVSMVQAQSQFDTAQRHLQTLNSVGQREQLRAAQAQMDAAKAHWDNAAVQLSYAQITTPISGVVADRPVYPGEMAAPGAPLLSIVDISQVVARANIPVKDASFIKVGSPATLAGPEGNIAGKVTVVSPAVDPATTTIEVWVQAPNPDEQLKPGGTVRVSIKAETLKDVTIVPASAILNFDEGGEKVMIALSNGTAAERRINVGVRQGDNVQIVSGVSEGEKVIIAGGLGLENKAKIKILEPPAEAADDDEDK